MGKKVSKKTLSTAGAFLVGGPVAAYMDKKDKDKDKQRTAEMQAQADRLSSQQTELDALKAAEEQQELVRKKYAALGRVSAGTAFSDGAATASTKVFS